VVQKNCPEKTHTCIVRAQATGSINRSSNAEHGSLGQERTDTDLMISLSILGELMGGYGGEVLGAVGRLVRAPLT
jgi:hypothetical protein